MRRHEFDVFIGVDQTGAVVRRGNPPRPVPRPLQCALLARKHGAWELTPGIELPSLSAPAVLGLIDAAGVPPARCALMVDCVFGLSRELELERGPASFVEASDILWRCLSATRDGVEGSGGLGGSSGSVDARYGRAPAEAHFARILERSGRDAGIPFPRRECEVLARANSVFQTRPFQKNIQTGTYRIWKDLVSGPGPGASPRWLNFWPFESAESKLRDAPWIFEGFPTHFWRHLLGLPTRDRKRFRRALLSRLPAPLAVRAPGWASLVRDPDRADAAVLALGGWMLQEQGRLFEPFSGFRGTLHPQEGWIAGLAAEPGRMPLFQPPLSSRSPSAPPDTSGLPRSGRAKGRPSRPKRPK